MWCSLYDDWFALFVVCGLMIKVFVSCVVCVVLFVGWWCSSFVGGRCSLMCVVCCVLVVESCVFCVACCVLFVVRCVCRSLHSLLFDVCRLLCVGRCLVFVVCCWACCFLIGG